MNYYYPSTILLTIIVIHNINYYSSIITMIIHVYPSIIRMFAIESAILGYPPMSRHLLRIRIARRLSRC